MISAIQDEIQQHFMESSWMDLKAKIRAIKKVDNIKKIIGYPDWYNQGGKIDGYYDKVTVYYATREECRQFLPRVILNYTR